MNFFDVTVTGDAAAPRLQAQAFSMPVPASRRDEFAPYFGRKLILGVRPENIHDKEFQPSGIEAGELKAQVDVTELMGNEQILHLLVDGAQFLARVDPRSKARPGADIDLVIDEQEIHAFDPESQLAIDVDAGSREPASA